MSRPEPIDAVAPSRHFDFTPESSWDDVQSQYRRLVQHWHPDRHPPGTRDRAQAEFIEITTAFKRLQRHYGDHGRLPGLNAVLPSPEDLAADARRPNVPRAPDFPAPTHTPTVSTTRLRAFVRSPATAVAAALMIAVSLVFLVISLDRELATERREQALSRSAETAADARAAERSGQTDRNDDWNRPAR